MGVLRYILTAVLLMAIATEPCRADEELSPVQRMSRVLAELKHNPSDIPALIEASETYIDLCDWEGAKQMASRLAAASRQSPDSVRALYYARLLGGRACLLGGQGPEGLKEITQAYEIARNHKGMATELAMAGDLMGYAYVNMGLNLSQGLAYYSDALAEARKAGDYALVVRVLNNLSEAYFWENFVGMKYAEEALKISRDHDYKYGIALSLINIIHYRLFFSRDISDVGRMSTEVKRLQDRYGFLPQGEISLLEGRLVMTYDNDAQAIPIFAESLDHSAPLMPTLLKIQTYLYYSWALIKAGRYDEAVKVSSEALSLCRSTGYNRYSISLTSGIAYCYEKLGNYREAFDYLRKYQTHMDSLWITGQMEAMTKAHVENEVRLNESKISRQESKINAQGKYIVTLIVIGGVLILCLLLVLSLYRRKGQLVRAVVEREKESLLREKLLRQSLEQTRAELAEADKSPEPLPQPQTATPLTEERMDDLIVRFNELMTEKRVYTDPSVSIKSVAETLGTNRTYLSYAINHVFNKSFPQVLAEYRIHAAIDLMNNLENDLPLKAVAAEVGFSSSSVFFTTFRNIMGMTPTAYRNSLTEL